MALVFDYDFMMRHHTENKSVRALAIEAGVHPNQLRRAMIRAGIEIKSRSQSLKDAYDNGNIVARKGFNISKDHKAAISKANKGKVFGLRNTTNNFILNPKLKQAIRDKSASKNREAAKKGSKFERNLIDSLRALGYNVEGQYVLGDYRIDLYLAAYNLAIEIDGISHREPIYGPDKLENSKIKDKEKDEAMKQKGMSIVRILDNQRGVSQYNVRVVSEFIVETIGMLKTKNYLYRVLEIN